MTQIVVYERTDGTMWADYVCPLGANHRPVHLYELKTRGDHEALIAAPGDYLPERVRALALRGLKEFLARSQQPETVVAPTPTIVSLRDRGFWGRTRWLFTGK